MGLLRPLPVAIIVLTSAFIRRITRHRPVNLATAPYGENGCLVKGRGRFAEPDRTIGLWRREGIVFLYRTHIGQSGLNATAFDCDDSTAKRNGQISAVMRVKASTMPRRGSVDTHFACVRRQRLDTADNARSRSCISPAYRKAFPTRLPASVNHLSAGKMWHRS